MVELHRLLRQLHPDTDDLSIGFLIARSYNWGMVETAHLRKAADWETSEYPETSQAIQAVLEDTLINMVARSTRSCLRRPAGITDRCRYPPRLRSRYSRPPRV